MAKGAGSTKASKWPRKSQDSDTIEDLYSHDGARVEYKDLPEEKKDEVKAEKKRIAKALSDKLKDVTTKQVIDDGVEIEIHYTNTGVEHFCNDAMLTLSGKYFSEKSMMRIDEILAKSNYVQTSHVLTHPRKDKRNLWFAYQDSDGRGVFFKITLNDDTKHYELYSVTDALK